MRYPEYIIEHFVFEEGLRLQSYQDTLGYWTVGVGHLLGKSDKFRNVVITEQQAYEMLEEDIDTAVNICKELFPDYAEYPKSVKLALLDMAFNLGKTKLSKFTKTLRLVRSRNFAEAAAEARNSLWAKQVPNRARRTTKLLEMQSDSLKDS